ncbi:thioredoxin-disulfide reductase [Streptococcus pantholopis]|uniref:Thioredoxin reductase n=1 Tax=Streptococcus pantholopis TaxID=1811193 RepID=A0A172Q7N3_9STRE|nr:thioredoxin-disulfide reductase [Streptococcus pantholopis]AND79499.1 thioredoxin-disulfide reductase [Streptococcus pantholopis]
MYDTVIIGSGPAGYTAGIYLSRSGLKNRLITGYAEGGQLTTTTLVENYPGFEKGVDGNELVAAMSRQAQSFGTEMTFARVEKIEGDVSPFTLHLDTGELVKARTVILATGSTAKYLGIDGENETIGKGVSACATCDGFFYKNRKVIVVGGGDVAMEEALFLTKFASKVILVHRREQLRASDIMVKRAKANPKIHWKLGYLPEKVHSNETGMTGLDIKSAVTGETETIEASGLFVAIGHQPNTDFVKDYIRLDSAGYIKTQPGSSKTSRAGIFAAGDVQDPKYQQAVTSAGSGAVAALDAAEFIYQF